MERQNFEVTDESDKDDKFLLLCQEVSLGGLAAQTETRPGQTAPQPGDDISVYEIFTPAEP